ncbi:polyprenyl synthetase family protein [Cellulomonas sp. KRMCY2]|uniref:polyprenyl synthetase family protein n=1 Tax=Cellulomonas sp. KRMCY2 TaxID=1304865 RepID=UPI00045EB8F5|nr:polyprenyl synthetase family protein [Cellulomonas sp. KRMCY2]
MTSSAAALVDVEQVRTGVDAALAGHVTVLAGELTGIGPDSAPLVEAVRDMLGGGKRLRAAFCYWSWRAHGGAADGPHAQRSQVLAVGAALELFQAAALFHDDVMDDSDTRRGLPAAHRRFADLHVAEGWTGPSQRFGDAAAILLGDLALIASERQFAAAVEHVATDVRDAARGVFDRMRTEVTVGQYLDVLAQALPWGQDATGDERRARAVIRAKSARYSVEHPLTLGAALAGADDEALARCRMVGLPLGEAFQLRDDLLGVFGDPSTTGKPAGDDLREGKRTVLIARALGTASPQDRALITEKLGHRDLTDAEVDLLRAAVLRSGAARAVDELIGTLAEPALTILADAPLAEPGRSMLVDLGRAAVDRHA